MIARAGIVLSFLATLAACAAPASAPRVAREVPPPPPEIAPEEMFATAIEEVCFAALSRQQFPSDRLRRVEFEETDMAAERFRSTPDDRLYRARFANSPVLVSIAPGVPRCDVIAVKGDRDRLRKVAEAEIKAFNEAHEAAPIEYLAALDRSPRWALKFTLRSGDLVGDDSGLYADEELEVLDPFAITE